MFYIWYKDTDAVPACVSRDPGPILNSNIPIKLTRVPRDTPHMNPTIPHLYVGMKIDDSGILYSVRSRSRARNFEQGENDEMESLEVQYFLNESQISRKRVNRKTLENSQVVYALAPTGKQRPGGASSVSAQTRVYLPKKGLG